MFRFIRKFFIASTEQKEKMNFKFKIFFVLVDFVCWKMAADLIQSKRKGVFNVIFFPVFYLMFFISRTCVCGIPERTDFSEWAITTFEATSWLGREQLLTVGGKNVAFQNSVMYKHAFLANRKLHIRKLYNWLS